MKAKLHPCVFCSNSRWDKVPHAYGLEKPVFKLCIIENQPDETCSDLKGVNPHCRLAIIDSLNRCGATGFPD